MINNKYRKHVQNISGKSQTRLRFADHTLSGLCDEAEAVLVLTDSIGRTHRATEDIVLANIDYDAIVGKTWLDANDVLISNRTNSVIFNFNSISHADKLRTLRLFNERSHRTRTRDWIGWTVRINTIDLEDIEKEDPTEALDLDSQKSLEERLNDKFGSQPNVYKDMLRKYPKLIPEELPPVGQLQTEVTHPIQLIEGAKPKVQPIYHCSQPELIEMKRQIETLLKAGHIRHSTSPWSSSVLFVKKKGSDKLRMCIDFRHLNRMTVKDATPIARIDELRQRLQGAEYFTALDMMQGYYQTIIQEACRYLTAFNCRYGHYEWNVMPFGLCNAPATFSRWITIILGDCIDKFVVAYLDDILIFSRTREEHRDHVEEVLRRLSRAGAYLGLIKCEFEATSVDFLGHKVSGDGVTLNPSYVQPILDWPLIRNKSDLASFCGMINYFKSWIPGYADICEPLNKLRKKTAHFVWTEDQQTAVIILQHYVSSAPVLAFFDADQETTIYSDASAYAVGGWIGQHPKDAVAELDAKGQPKPIPDRPILFYSRKCTDAETRYGTHERELLAIVEMLRVTRPYIEGRPFTARTDHDALKWLQTQPQLSRRQAGWVEKLQSYDMYIEYQPGKLNHVSDALSRRPDYMPNCPRCSYKFGVEAGGGKPVSTDESVDPKVVDVDTTVVAHHHVNDELPDDELKEIEQLIESTEVTENRPTWTIVGKRAYYGSRQYIPRASRDEILYLVHDVDALHAGNKRTIDRLAMNYYWPSMGKDTQNWIKRCDACQRKHKRDDHGLLRSLPIAKERFTDIAMDWFAPPSVENDYNQVLLIIDRHRKFLTLVACKTRDTAKDTARLYLQHVYPHAGIPRSMTVDRDSKWCSTFWTTFTDLLGIKMNIATARHQNTNGLAEQAVKTTKRTLTTLLNRLSSWIDALPIVAFAYNSTPHTSTGFTPFEMTFGTNLASITDHQLRSTKKETDDMNAVEVLDRTREISTEATKHMEKAAKQQANSYDRHRKDIKFTQGQQVLLSRNGIEHAISTKYLYPYLGPFIF